MTYTLLLIKLRIFLKNSKMVIFKYLNKLILIDG